MMKIVAVGFVVALGASAAWAQAPQVKTGYEVKGPTCYYRLPNGRVQPVDCWHWRRAIKRAGEGGDGGGSGAGGDGSGAR